VRRYPPRSDRQYIAEAFALANVDGLTLEPAPDFNVAPQTMQPIMVVPARLFHGAGDELEQIQFLLGHASVQTTERYIGCRQKFKDAVNDCFESQSQTQRDNGRLGNWKQ
jgi:hypothetical protein